jgi:hypothetical protein
MRTINCSLTVGSPRDRGCRAGWFTRCLTSKWLVLFSVALLAMAISAVTASAQTCLLNEYNLATKGKLQCTANDVRIAAVTNIRDPKTGATLTSCIGGQPFDFLADFEILTTSSQARENIGLYIATNSTTQALTGTCVDRIISQQHPCTTNTSLSCGSDNYHETDPPPDNCGDTASGDFSATFGAGAEKVTLEIDGFMCTAPAGSTQLVLPNCTSWQIPGGTIQCVSNSPDTYPFNGPGGTPTAIPGSPSKCNCGVIPLAISVQTPGIDVGKACNTTYTTTTPSFSLVGTPPQLTGSPASCTTSCTPGGTCSPTNYEGGQVTYTVDIANDKSNFGDVTVTQICDSAYGQIFPVPPPTAPFTGTCNAGSQCVSQVTGSGCATSTTCTAATIAFGASHTCTFTVTQAESKTVTNTASVSVTGASNGTASGGSNSVTVTSGEAPSLATATKNLNTPTNACVTERYQVDVANTSTADENLSLTALNDTAADFGSITSVHDSILGTTCGVAASSPGLGTLNSFTVVGPSGTDDSTHLRGGSLADSLTVRGNDYVCYFDGQLCSSISTANNCFTHTNSINATITGDESEAVTITANTVHAHVCVTVTPQ